MQLELVCDYRDKISMISPSRLITGFRNFLRKHGRISNGALEQSLVTRVCTTLTTNQLSRVIYSFQKSRHSPFLKIVTLDPNKLVEKKQPCLHIGGRRSFYPCTSLPDQSRRVNEGLYYDSGGVGSHHHLYPPDTKGFLYYSMSPGRPRIAGELRFRVTQSDDPASFESGSDLLRINGLPWSRPLYALSKVFLLLYEKLKEEGFVPDDLDRFLLNLPLVSLRYSRSQVLYTLNDTFIVDFSHCKTKLIVITEQGVERLELDETFSDTRVCGQPYTGAYTKSPNLTICFIFMNFVGSALARFERSTLPNHKDTRTVVLRFLEIITPVKCIVPLYGGHMCCPKNGELYQRIRGGKEKHVWSINIDKSSIRRLQRGLLLLWDI